MIKVIKAGVIKKPWYIKLDKVIELDQSQSLFLYMNIINISINVNTITQIDKSFSEVVDMTARRYGCRPSDIMLSNSNQIEKAIYDFTICNIGYQKDYLDLKKQITKQKQRRK